MNFNQEQALKLLKEYSTIEIKIVQSEVEKKSLAQALLFIANLADDQNLGICANNAQEAFKTLDCYLKALGYTEEINPHHIIEENEPVYLKFSTERMSYNLETYAGEYRGVLITMFAEFNEQIVGTYGYLPLDLFDS